MEPANENNKEVQSTLKDAGEEVRPVVVRREPERDLISWHAYARPFKRLSKQFYIKFFSIAGTVSLVVFLAEGIMPVLLIISLVFLYYVLTTVQPDEIEYKITSKGIRVDGKITEWQFLNRYWFSNRFGNEILIFETSFLPGRIEMVINSELKESLKKEISAYIPYEEVPISVFDHLINWFSEILLGNK